MKLKNLILISSIVFCWGCDSQTDSNKTESEQSQQEQSAGFITNSSNLPFYGPVDVINGDTTFYTIPKFYLLDQDSIGFGNSFFKDSYMVVDFFFTTCSTICPIMTSEMSALQSNLKLEELLGKVKFLSVTIDPQEDSPSVLKEYAIKNNADFSNWKFATGDLTYIDELSKEGFFLAVDRNAAYQDGIIHSSQLILVDPDLHVRGSYDGIDVDEMNRLFEDIKMLINE